ncbi:MAG: 2'-5' RNA ligase family protein [Legionella longbeachae]|nr:2'-5' RNA ligase family protein [Legionella longbeachae]
MCFFVATTAKADSLPINIYLKLKPNNTVEILIKKFNQFLRQQGILTAYNITPYITQHPLHVTLYLANYDPKQIATIIAQTKTLAKQQNSIPLLTSAFIPNNSGYVMLSVAYDPEIQKLSNHVLKTLAHLRDKKAIIPTWASQDRERLAIFHQYGSPNVLNFFKPHFSLFSAEHLSPEQGTHFYQQLQKEIVQFAQLHQAQVRATAYAIGIGVSDAQGQIVKELASFNLRWAK